ncbi:Fic/DOC family protein [Azomonas macrocytogenes]|uniref:protein adenylyltransferase n=1 Tax=Azomonas macrocytogenes TaxID=69962 RepID=A0A839T182_AZOMA|nr:fido (protein-threonine AMPylation protein) [Azomonas macrocytogenes]
MSPDKYCVSQDPDCYPGTDVLENLLDLHDEEDLNEAERYLSGIAAERLEFVEPPYGLGNLKYIHRTLFSEIYSWAGEIRRLKISKGGNQFCVPDRIEPEAAKAFGKMNSAGWFEGYPRDSLVNASSSNGSSSTPDMRSTGGWSTGKRGSRRISPLFTATMAT